MKLLILCFAAILVVTRLLGVFLPIDKFLSQCVRSLRRALPDGFCEEEEVKTDKTQTNMNENEKNNLEEQFATILQKMGCTIRERDNGDIVFQYQGEWFLISTVSTNLWVTIRDFSWHDVPLDDIDELALVRKTVNEINCNNIMKLVYRIDEESKLMRVETLFHFVAMPETEDFEDYLRAVFRCFFIVKLDFCKRLDSNRKKA